MNTRRFVVLAVIVMVLAVLPALAVDPAQAVPSANKPLVPATQAQRVPRVATCSISGQLKLDQADHTNGFLHYKGNVTFKAGVNLEGVNLYLQGPKYSCTCVTCPRGSSHATGLQPEGKFNAGDTKLYMADCGSFPTTATLAGPLGKGKIEHFIRTSGDAGIFGWVDCSGSLRFGN